MYITVTILGKGGEGRLIVTHFFALKAGVYYFQKTTVEPVQSVCLKTRAPGTKGKGEC